MGVDEEEMEEDGDGGGGRMEKKVLLFHLLRYCTLAIASAFVATLIKMSCS